MKKLITLILTLTVFFPLLADTPERTLNDYLAAEYNNAIKAYESKLEACQASEVVVTPNDIKHITDDWNILSSAIAYHYAKTQDLCTHNELVKFTVLSAKLQALDDTHKPIFENYNKLIMAIPLAYERTKIDYFVLPKNLREQFLKIEKLNKPFNLMKTMESFE
ncbi:hypothetical protein [Pseudoalteromonas sp. SIMBA_162]|uniref:hypothetical protein n=1 Tax=Pseudoalteromonas sp. SIMBA_162 TaxID=3080867 RepID=UPI003979DC51